MPIKKQPIRFIRKLAKQTKQATTATERVISQMVDSNRGGHIWYCDRCETSVNKPNLAKTCKCGAALRFIQADSKNRQYNF